MAEDAKTKAKEQVADAARRIIAAPKSPTTLGQAIIASVRLEEAEAAARAAGLSEEDIDDIVSQVRGEQ